MKTFTILPRIDLNTQNMKAITEEQAKVMTVLLDNMDLYPMVELIRKDK